MTARLAVVTLRIPSALGGAVAVTLPLWRPAFTVPQARRIVDNTTLIGLCVDDAATAHQQGNPSALVIAVRVLQGRPDLPWPAWLSAAVRERLEAGAERGARSGGRHAQRLAQWQDDMHDYTRFRAIELLKRRIRKGTSVYRVASEQLGAGDSDVLRKAYERVQRRLPLPAFQGELRHAARYFPDVGTLHILAALDTIANAE